VIAPVVPDTLKLRHRDMRDMCVGAAVLTGLSVSAPTGVSGRDSARHLTPVRMPLREGFG